MKIEPNEPILFGVSQHPLGFVIQNASGETMTFRVPVELARKIALALLSVPEVGRNFNEVAEWEAIRRLEARQLLAATN